MERDRNAADGEGGGGEGVGEGEAGEPGGCGVRLVLCAGLCELDIRGRGVGEDTRRRVSVSCRSAG